MNTGSLTLTRVHDEASSEADVLTAMGRLVASRLPGLVRSELSKLDRCSWQLAGVAVWADQMAGTDALVVAGGFRDLICCALATNHTEACELLVQRDMKVERRLDAQERRMRYDYANQLPEDLGLLASVAQRDHADAFEPLWLLAAIKAHQLGSVLQGKKWRSTTLTQSDAVKSLTKKADAIDAACPSGAAAVRALAEAPLVRQRHAEAHGDWAFDHTDLGTVEHLDSLGKVGGPTRANASELAKRLGAVGTRAPAVSAAIITARVDLHLDCQAPRIEGGVCQAFLAESHLPLIEVVNRDGQLLVQTARAAHARTEDAPQLAKRILRSLPDIWRVLLYVIESDEAKPLGEAL